MDVPPAFVPVTGGTNEEGQPEPPPVHALFSVVVRDGTSWHPYSGAELAAVDVDAARAIGTRLRQLDALLGGLGVPASIELAYGPAAALCEVDPDVFDELEASGHRIGIHVRSNGEVFRAHEALAACGRRPTTVSGLAHMADPLGPGGPSPDSLNESMGVLSVLDLLQVVGRVSPVCVELGLAEATHGYGTGSFTAPWRSGWTEGNACEDLPRGRIVIVDQTALAPIEGAQRIDASALSVLASRTDQMLGYALDHRFAEADELPHPGVITWGVTVRLHHLIAPEPDPEGDEAGEGGAVPVEPEIDPRVARLSETTLAELRVLIEERWLPSMEQDRLLWMLPDDLALILRPLPEDEA